MSRLVAGAASYPAIAVTGANGWLGRRLVATLVKGLPGAPRLAPERIRCLVPASEDARSLRAAGVDIIAGDVRDPEACRALVSGSDGGLLLHVAGIIHPPGRTRLFDEVNVGGTANLVAAARRAGVRRIVAMSSNSPFGFNATHDARFDEDSAFRPYMGYGRSKWRMELLLQAVIAAGLTPEVVICRAPWFYGPGQPLRQTQFLRMVRAGRFPLLGDGGNRRSMGYVDSLALGMMLAAAVPEPAGRTYWLADEAPYRMRDIVETVRAVFSEDFGLAVSGRVRRVPALVAEAARAADGALQGLGLYHAKVHVLGEMSRTIACSIERAKRELGYRPLVALREGMRRSVAWCLAHGQPL